MDARTGRLSCDAHCEPCKLSAVDHEAVAMAEGGSLAHGKIEN
jgi:hypothetical protein